MPANRSSNSETRPTSTWIKNIEQLGLLLVLGLLFSASATAEQQAPLTINLQQTSRMDGAAGTATLYLKRIIEQRTDQRIKLLLHLAWPEDGSTPDIPVANMQMAAIGSEHQAEELKQQPSFNMQRLGGNQDDSYQLLVDIDFWGQLSAELKIILQGAARDTIEYISELKGKN